MNFSIRERLAQGLPLLADGALATYHAQVKNQFPVTFESLIHTSSSELTSLAIDYFTVGSEILHAATFSMNRNNLARLGLDNLQDILIRQAIQAASALVGDRAWYAGVIGPLGISIPEDHKMSEKSSPWRAEMIFQAQIMIEEGVDLIAFETQTSLQEAVEGVRCVHEISSETPVAVQMHFVHDREEDLWRCLSGESLQECVKLLSQENVDLIGANCGTGVQDMIPLAYALRLETDLPLIFQPSAGIPTEDKGRMVWPDSAKDFTDGMLYILETKPGIVGGCCGTTPAHIKALNKILSENRTN